MLPPQVEAVKFTHGTVTCCCRSQLRWLNNRQNKQSNSYQSTATGGGADPKRVLFCPRIGKLALKADELQNAVNCIRTKKNFWTNHLIKGLEWTSLSINQHDYRGIAWNEKEIGISGNS